MTYKKLSYSVEEGVATLSLDDPPKNTMDSLFFNELNSLCTQEIRHENFHALIITSKGRHFSEGANINHLKQIVCNNPNYGTPEALKRNWQCFEIINNLKRPAFAIIKGVCLGSGFELALCAQYRIITKNALFSLPEASYNLMPGLGGIYKLRHLIGAAKTLDIVLTGKTITATEAIQTGIADYITEKHDIRQFTLNKIKQLSKKQAE